MRTLMRYAPRKYDPALIEALAINGALKPDLDKDGKAKAIAKVAEWLDAGDLEATWSGEVAAEGGYLLKRLWRGVTDAHIIEPSFLVSAEARKLDALAEGAGRGLRRRRRRCARSRRARRPRPSRRWRRAKARTPPRRSPPTPRASRSTITPPVRTARRGARRRAARASRSSATRALAK